MDHKDLKIWQRSTDMVINIYRICNKLPDVEKYGLASKMQRAAVSIPSNIAEGYRRNSKKDFKRFLSISIGSAAELETQLIITERLYGVEVDSEIKDLVEIQRMILSFQKKLT